MLPYPVRFTKSQIDFGLAAPNDDAGVLSFLCHIFSRVFTPEWFHWFAYENPRGPVRYYVARDAASGAIVATYGLVPLRLGVHGSERVGALCVDVGVHESWQGTGMFQELGRYALDRDTRDYGTDIVLALPNRLALQGHLRIGWHRTKDLVIWSSQDRIADQRPVADVAAFGPEIDGLVREMNSRYGLSILKDHRWLNWRCSRPGQSYTKHIAHDGDAVAGYMVLKQFHDTDRDYTKTHVIDLFANTDKAFSQLIAAAQSSAKESDELNVWGFSGTRFSRSLASVGFAPTEDVNPLIFYSFDQPTHASIVMGDDWHLVMADSDVY